MCGIAGFWWHKEPTPGILQRMAHWIRHRGPDEDGFFVDGPVGLANRRLSIIDLEHGRQPIFNEDRSVVVVYNGEIYNTPELRTDLLQKGHRFSTHTDTEVLAHLYEEQGPDFVSRLRGMFAFALYDREKRELLLARDPFGIKPLVYSELPSGVAFASELRALLALPEFPRDPDPEAIALYTAFNYIPAPYTIWKAARRLPPGHLLRIREGKIVEIRHYGDLGTNSWQRDVQEAVEVLTHTLQESVKAHLLSDVPVGVFLSGGLDSSLVCALAQRAAEQPLRTFTVTFPEWPVYNEAHYARQVAAHLGTLHEEIPVTSHAAQQALEEIVTHLDEPFADSSLVNVAIISKMARRYVKVVLSGDGGDELFAGYNKYQGLRLAQKLQSTPLGWLLQSIVRFPWPEQRGSYLGERIRQVRKLARLLSPDAFERYYRATLATDPQLFDRLLHLDSSSDHLPQEILWQTWQDAQTRGFTDVNQWLWSDAHFVLPYDMLHKVDTASMRYSLEVRVPFVDKEVARRVFSFPGDWKLRGLERKWILKRVASRYLPKEILERPKGGFGIPIGEWMREELKALFQDYLSPEALKGSVWNIEEVSRLWEEHLHRRRDRYWELWNIFVFEVWRQRWGVEF